MENTEMPQMPHLKVPTTSMIATWTARAFLAALIITGGWSAWKLSSRVIGGSTDRLLRESNKSIDADKVEKPQVYDKAWTRKMNAEISALGSEVQAAKEAYARQKDAAKDRTFSREDDRKEIARLNQIVLDLEQKRAEAVALLIEHE